MVVLTKSAVDVFAPTDGGGAPRKVENEDAQTWGTEIERSIANGIIGTSATSLAIGTGSKTFAINEPSRAWTVGSRLRAMSTAATANFMEGTVTAYADDSLTLDIDAVGGSGTKADWTINLAGTKGATGDTGAKGDKGDTGATGATGAAGTNGTNGTNGSDGLGVPSGGSKGQALKKASATDNDTVWATAREVLTAARTYYVRTDGSDSNTGLSNTSGGAFLTYQKAMDIIASDLDLGPYIVTIQGGAGTYTGNLVLKSYRSTSGYVYFLGDMTTPSNVLMNASSGSPITTDAGAAGYFRIRGFKLSGASASRGLYVLGPSVKVDIGEIDFGANSLRHMEVDYQAQVAAIGNLFVSGNTTVGFWANRQGIINLSGRTVTYLANVTYSARNWNASEQGWIDGFSVTFTLGSFTVTGVRYLVDNLGGIFTSGGGASYIPGSTAGSGNGINGAIYV